MIADPNALTLDAYEKGWREYLAGTPKVPLTFHGFWLTGALAARPCDSTVLEIGSGPGHDAAAMELLDIKVERTDGAAAFVAHLREQGHEARQLNVLKGDIGGPYGMIYAFAVFQHFTPAQHAEALRRCAAALEPGGVLAFSVRRGSGADWRARKGLARRFFMFWQPGPLWEAVENAGLRVLSVHQDTQTAADADHEDKTWLLVTAIRD